MSALPHRPRALRPTLRLRLTLWFLVTYVVVFTGVLLGAWALHRVSTREMVDDGLTQLAENVATALQAETAPQLQGGLRPMQPIDHAFSVLALRDGDGNVLASRWLLDASALPPIPDEPKAESIRPIDGEPARALLGRSISSRMITYRFTMPDGQVRYLDIARTTDLEREEDDFLRDMTVIGLLGALVASVLAAWLVAGRAVQPIARITEAAQLLDRDRPSARVEVRDRSAEVTKLQNALNDALERLEDGYRAQERFISNVAHDLKTPIAVMLTESQVLRPERTDVEAFESYRQSMIAEMQRLGGLVESFLTLARADQSEALARMTDVSALDVLMDAVSECGTEATQLDVHVVPIVQTDDDEEEFPLHGDPNLLRAMLVNLVRNAMRHSTSGARVDVELSADAVAVSFVVRDHGPGIPAELHDTIFDRFVQAPNDRARVPGTGLGLAIARSVAVVHGGTITVESEAGAGCAFVVRLPIDGAGTAERDALTAAATTD